jgi:hypothetical protein
MLGAGMTRFSPQQLDRYRRAVDAPATGLALAAILHHLAKAGWRDGGASLRRVPPPFDSSHERAELLKRTGLLAERDGVLPPAVHGPALAALLVAEFRRLLPLHRWLVALR